MQGHDAPCCHHRAPAETGASTDPVCGMAVAPSPDALQTVHQDMSYFFCSTHCREAFKKNPGQYLNGTRAEAQALPGAIYRCPMDPEVEQDHPGACPKCGMALEAMLDFSRAGEAIPNIELDDMQRRFWRSLAFSGPLLFIAMGRMSLPLPWHAIAPEIAWHWLEALLATLAVFWAGWPILDRGIQSFQRRQLNMFSLITVGVFSAFGVSLTALLAPKAFAFQSHPPIYFESAAVITTLVLLGQVLELRARAKTSQAIQLLFSLAPKTAIQVIDGEDDKEVALNDIQAGMKLRLRPGDKTPVDGIVITGEAEVDESMLTGEPMPVFKQAGDWLSSGTVAMDGSVVMEAKRVGNDTLLAGIIRNIQQAQFQKPDIQRLADKVSAIFVPTVFGVALLTGILWYIFGNPDTRLSFAILNAISVLIIACPCALGLATPLSIMVATGKGASAGILFRDVSALEKLAGINFAIFDKTGTLTHGKPQIKSVTSLLKRWDEGKLLQYAASLEQSSAHPIAHAFLTAAKEKNIPLLEVSQFKSITGHGVEGTVNGDPVRIGNLAFMQTNLPGSLKEWEKQNLPGETVIFIAVQPIDQWLLAGCVTLQDELREDAKRTISTLHDQGIETLLLSGDRKKSVRCIAETLEMAHWEGDATPERKADVIRGFQKQGRRVVMAGDGINDAPALAQADIGIAMGNGSDIALETADATLMRGGIGSLLSAIRLSRAANRNIRENLFFAFAYNTIGIPIAAGVLYPAFGILLNPMFAAAAMSLSSVCVALNALRLHRVRI